MAGLEFSVPFNDDGPTMRNLLALHERNGNRIRLSLIHI